MTRLVLDRRQALGAAALWGVAGSDAFAQSGGKEPRSITVAIQALRPVLEPVASAPLRSIALRTIQSVFEGLLGIDYLNDMRVQPVLAERYRRIDEQTWEFTLRPDVRFHDGGVMTADDVVFSLGPERMTGPQALGRVERMIYQSNLGEVTKVDDRTVRVSSLRPSPTFEAELASWGAQIVSQAAFRRAKDWQSWIVAPVGTGPYRITSFQPDQSLQLRAHDAYWRGRPPLAGVRFLAAPELAARLNGLYAGEFDIIADVTPDQIATIEARKGLRVVGGTTTVVRLVNFDAANNPQLRDPRLRQAMSLAVNRELIVETLWLKRNAVPNGFQFPTFGALFDEKRRGVAFDPDKARQLLKESSYRGERIAFRTTGSTYTLEMATTQVLVEMWQAVGINVGIETVENFSQLFKRPGAGLYNYSTAQLYPDPVSDFWRSYGADSQVQRVEQSWSNDEFNRLGAVLASSSNTEERRRAYQRMLDIFEWEDPAAIILSNNSLFYGMRDDLNWKPYPAYNMDFGPAGVSPA